jgi:hypothetical protein
MMLRILFYDGDFGDDDKIDISFYVCTVSRIVLKW